MITANPMNYYCAPNAATPDYVTAYDFRDFIAYGMTRCWLGSDQKDPNSDCHMDREVTPEDVQELRGYFLDTMETLIAALWKGDFEPGEGWIEGDFQSLFFGDESFHWMPRLDDDAIMLELSPAESCIWLAYETIQDVAVLTEARRHAFDKNVWSKLTDLAQCD
jgi:hypothetical protein